MTPMSINLCLPTQPKFSGIAYVNEFTHGRGLPKTTAYLGDYSSYGYTDGVVLVKTPSGKIKILDDDHPETAALTQSCNKAQVFTDERSVFPSDFRQQIANVFTDFRARFIAGQWPSTTDKRGESFYEALFEKPYEPGTLRTEQILTDALGYDFETRVPSKETRNKRLIQMDRNGSVFSTEA